MFAVIKTGGKQYRVSAGDRLRVEKIAAEVGGDLVLDQVLMVGEGEAVKLGTPLVAGAAVSAKVIAQGKAEKITVFKLRRRKHHKKTQGHRQPFTEIEITGIAG